MAVVNVGWAIAHCFGDATRHFLGSIPCDFVLFSKGCQSAHAGQRLGEQCDAWGFSDHFFQLLCMTLRRTAEEPWGRASLREGSMGPHIPAKSREGKVSPWDSGEPGRTSRDERVRIEGLSVSV
jgi:hypothetical protein